MMIAALVVKALMVAVTNGAVLIVVNTVKPGLLDPKAWWIGTAIGFTLVEVIKLLV